MTRSYSKIETYSNSNSEIHISITIGPTDYSWVTKYLRTDGSEYAGPESGNALWKIENGIYYFMRIDDGETDYREMVPGDPGRQFFIQYMNDIMDETILNDSDTIG